MNVDAWMCAWRELRRRKARAVVSVCGYALATAATAILATWLYVSRRAADEVLSSTGTHFMAFVPASGRCPGCTIKRPEAPGEGFVANGVAAALFPADLVERVRKLPTVADASPFLLYRFRDPNGGHTFTVGGFDVHNTMAVGTTCCAAADVIGGRFLRPGDLGSVLAEEAYAQLRGLKVGDRATVAGREFTIVGVVNPGIRPAKADLYMPLAEAERAISARMPANPVRREANVVLVEVARATVQDEAIRSVRALLPGLLVSSYACYRPAGKVMGINARAAWLLLAVLGAGAVLLAAKTEWAWVVERRREIGILKAIGWSDGNVIAQVLAESVLQAAAGGTLGAAAAGAVLLAVPGEWVIGRGATAPAAVVVGIFVAASGLAAVGGLLAGIGPAVVAARRRPADAIRAI